MTTLADQTIAALRSGHDELTALVRGLSPDDLVRPSGASEWQVSQVLSHLGSGAEIGLATLTAARTGGAGPDGDFNQGVWARWNAMSPDEQASGFLAANQQLVEAYESLDATTREELRITLGFLPEPLDVATAARFRLGEFALHQWDVSVAFDPKATLSAEAVPLLVDQIGFLLGWISKPDALAGRSVDLTLRLSEPDRTLGLALGERIGLTDAPEEPDGELSMPAETWLRLASGRHSAAYLPDSVSLTGPLSLDDLRKIFPGF
jgi:uncharacterized protein (TIGR03083 family)